jgi:hypothetical protein
MGVELVVINMAVLAVGFAVMSNIRTAVGCYVQSACDVMAGSALVADASRA